MIELRDYQADMMEDARAAMRSGIRRFMLVLPTGGGKTAVSTSIISETAARGNAALFLCHRMELLEQTEATFEKAGLDYGVVAAGRQYEAGKPVYIGSIETVRRRLRSLPNPDLIIVDECSHIVSRTWKQVVDAWPDAWRIGLTATPLRLSGEGFEGVFNLMVLGPSVRDLIEAGWLAGFKYYAPPGVDAAGLHTRYGDYVLSEAAALMDRPHITGDAIKHYRRLSDGKRAVIFCASVAHSMNVAEAFRSAGVPARHVDGTTPAGERRQALEGFRDGSILALTNVNIFAEGVDVPALETAILLRPTRSLAMYLQMVGRALRPQEGKTALILDHVGAAGMHGLPDEPRSWTLHGRLRGSRTGNSGEQMLAVSICEDCYAAYKPAAHCPYCGAATKPTRREIEQREGELEEIAKWEASAAARREQGAAQTFEELAELGRQRGYRNPAFWASKVISGRKRGKRK